MKSIKIMFLLLGIFMSSSLLAQKFNKTDMNGMWKRSDGLIISISGVGKFSEGGHALVFHAGKSSWKCVKSCWKFREIKYKSGNMWIARNKMYVKKGDFTKDIGKVTLRMKADKKSFTANGFTFYLY